MDNGSLGQRSLDLRVIKTRKAIHDAFKKLLETNEYSQLTIAAISREACINRKTFYAHYPSIDALLEDAYEEKIRANCDNALRQTASEDGLCKVQSITASLMRALDEHVSAESNIVRNIGFLKLVDIAILPVEEFVRAERHRRGLPDVDHLHCLVACYVGCILTAYTDWYRRGSERETLEEVIAQVDLMLSGRLQDLL